MPPRPISPLILYLFANKLPFGREWSGASMVLMTEMRSFGSGLSDTEQFPQYRDVSGFSE
jgi:hypothetical protein